MGDFSTEKILKARKNYSCEYCNKKIIKGDYYCRHKGFCENSFYKIKQCLKCYVLTFAHYAFLNWDDEYYFYYRIDIEHEFNNEMGKEEKSIFISRMREAIKYIKSKCKGRIYQ